MKLTKEQTQDLVEQVKSIMPTIARIGKQKKLAFDYGYLYNSNPPYWECEFYNKKTGKTVEHYKAPTTKELLDKIEA